MSALAAVAIAGCLAVNPASDRITAADLAAAVPGLIVPAADAPVALAPAPGVQRIFRVPELRRLALRLQWNLEPSADVCFARPVSLPDPALLLDAMSKTLPQAAITILEYGRQAVPPGDIEFPLSGLHGANGTALWNGFVRYAGNRRFTVWARVRASVSVTRVVAAADLHPGQPIAADQLRLETHEELPVATPFLLSLDGALNKWPRAPIHAGTRLRPEMLQSPKDVVRGDTVTVDVREGGALLQMEAQAEASGAIGEVIPVLNLTSHKRFLARVEGKGRVSVGPARKVNP